MREIGTKVRLSTVYYSQTDGQTERTNQSLETYLQYYVNYSQRNWVQLLPMAQLALNNREATAIERSSFYTNFG